MFIAKAKTAALLVVGACLLGGDTGLLVHQAMAQKLKGNFVPADITAPIVSIAPDGKAFTVEIRPRAKGEQSQRVNIKIAEQTKLRFSAVTNGGARLVEGYQAHVWLQNGSPDTAAAIHLIGPEHLKPVPQITGRVTKVVEDGKSITVETSATPAKGKGPTGTPGVPAKSMEILIPAEARVTFSGVAPDAAGITEGYQAAVFLKEGASNVAAEVRFSGGLDLPQKGALQNPPLFTGIVVGATAKEVTLEVPAKSKMQAPQLLPVQINESTQIVYANVPTGGALPTVGYDAQAWFGQDATGPATKLRLSAPLDQGPDLSGPVRGVTPDGKGIVMMAQAKHKGEAPAEETIAITNQTKLIYNNVPPGGAKPTPGMEAQIWFQEANATTASRILFASPEGLTAPPGKKR